jgi:hypothetical protein
MIEKHLRQRLRSRKMRKEPVTILPPIGHSSPTHVSVSTDQDDDSVVDFSQGSVAWQADHPSSDIQSFPAPS